MAGNDIKENRTEIIELWNRKFKLVKRGLDENEIVPFVNELIKFRDESAQREEHFASLTKLAERTVVEADRLATEVKKDASEQAQAKSKEIVSKAEEQVRQMMEEKRKEVVTAAAEEAKALKVDAEREAKLILEQNKKNVQVEMAAEAQKFYNQMLQQLEAMQQQVKSMQSQFENKLPGIIDKTTVQVAASAALPEPKGMTATPESAKKPAAESGKNSEAQPAEQKKNQPGAGKTAEPLNAAMYDGEAELNILPPINIMQVIAIMQYLDSLPEIKATELIPIYDRPSIVVFLRKPLALVNVLMMLPEIREVQEVKDKSSSNGENKRRQIQIRLTEKAATGDAGKDSLNKEISSILSNSTGFITE
jgi:hypothetical protein